MKKMIKNVTVLLVIATAFAFTAPALRVSTKHSIKFSTFGVSGIFKISKANIAFDAQDLEASRFDVAIDVNSIKTSFELQDKHAKGEDWFEADKFPYMRFVSKRVVKNGASFQAIGDLNVHGITKEVTLPFKYSPTATGGVFEGEFTINRIDFKIGKPGGMVGEDVKVNVSVPVVK
ncbi:YceI family protein [Aridibaculum aurantiacum]|uniref:YceI family protein n=1 Tax=Aridibaculum aurantiacum TaxID=2810307 RepID=UPI001A9576EC|nr:YceI family protein [Aridibaculum aurantiacum]